MPTVRDILAVKGFTVHRVRSSATVLHAAELMNKHRIGALVVVDNEDAVVGMFTERDVLTRVVVRQLNASRTPVSEVMTNPVVCCTPETKLEEARAVFKNRRIRHMPVLNQHDELVGVVSIGDINAFNAQEQETTIHYMHEIFYGRA